MSFSRLLLQELRMYLFLSPRLRDKVTLKTNGRFIVRETEDGTSEMIITSAQRSDAGLYTCKIINEYGTKQSECKLEVKGKDHSKIHKTSVSD